MSDINLTNGWFFTNHPHRCPRCDHKPLRAQCGHCKAELCVTKNKAMIWFDRWSSRLACALLITGIIGVLVWINVWLYTSAARMLS